MQTLQDILEQLDVTELCDSEVLENAFSLKGCTFSECDPEEARIKKSSVIRLQFSEGEGGEAVQERLGDGYYDRFTLVTMALARTICWCARPVARTPYTCGF